MVTGYAACSCGAPEPLRAELRPLTRAQLLRRLAAVGLERHGARTAHNLLARIATRLLALAACVRLNHQRGRPSPAIANYTA